MNHKLCTEHNGTNNCPKWVRKVGDEMNLTNYEYMLDMLTGRGMFRPHAVEIIGLLKKEVQGSIEVQWEEEADYASQLLKDLNELLGPIAIKWIDENHTEHYSFIRDMFLPDEKKKPYLAVEITDKDRRGHDRTYLIEGIIGKIRACLRKATAENPVGEYAVIYVSVDVGVRK